MMFKCTVLQKVRFVICYTTIKIFKEAWWVELTTTICKVRKPRWAYIGLDFLPREDKFILSYNIKQDVWVVSQKS